jgi:mRNA-degrading endonuclease toxin of MazEF toxin-antitoxin module
VPIHQGQIVWARGTDPQGANEKCRPFVVLTLSEEIARGDPIVAAAITTTLPTPLTHEYVELPWHPRGSVRTRLKKRCAVCCRWIAELDPDNVEEIRGHVSGETLKKIIMKVKEINGKPDEAT